MKKSKYNPYRELILSGELTSSKIAQIIGDGCTASGVRVAKHRFLKYDNFKKKNRLWYRNNKTKRNAYEREYRTQANDTAVNLNTPWSDAENDLVLNSSLTGPQKARQLGRTIDAIYQQQTRLRQRGQ